MPVLPPASTHQGLAESDVVLFTNGWRHRQTLLPSSNDATLIPQVYDGPMPLLPYQVPMMRNESYGPPLSPYGMLSNILYVCPNAMKGQCNDYHNCHHVRRNPDHTITICKDFMRGYCRREQSRYCHPLPHIMVGAAFVPVSMGPHVAPVPQMFIQTNVVLPLSLCSPVLGPQSAAGTTTPVTPPRVPPPLIASTCIVVF